MGDDTHGDWARRPKRPPRDQASTSGPGRARRAQPQHGANEEDRGPRIPPEIEAKQLAPEVRRELSTLDRANADAVARHLVAAGELIDEDPEAALSHARAARARSGRIAAVREAVGIAAYQCGDWSQAISELRAARRMGSKSPLLPLIADCERGLGRPERALELARGPEAAKLTGDEADEMRIVAAGARADLGQLEQALTVLSTPQLDPTQHRHDRGPAVLCLRGYPAGARPSQRRHCSGSCTPPRPTSRVSPMPRTESASSADVGTLAQEHDCLLLDLDGTVFRGHELTDGASESLEKAAGRKLFVTNNASRSADQVAGHLHDIGLPATADDVVTSAQSAAHVLADQLEPGSRVLVVGTESLAAEITAVGLRPVRSYDDQPDAVVQGHSPETGWAILAEAALAIRAGALWVAANVDATLPTERGLLPGNGSMVAALKAATDAEPQVAGKPAPTLLLDALARGDFQTPLVVGDRLNTDIAGANAAGLPSLMVLTGVNSARDAVHAIREQRATFIGHDLRSLHEDADALAVAAQSAWHIDTRDASITVSSAANDDAGDGLSIVRAVANAVWSSGLDGPTVTIKAGDNTAHDALQRWSLT